MHQRKQLPSASARNPFARLAASIVSAIALVVAAVLGAFVFLVVLGVVAVLASAIWLRIAWLRRRLRRQAPAGSRKTDQPDGTIEGEYRVIDPVEPSRHA